MTVKELIDVLRTLPQDVQVWGRYENCVSCRFVSVDLKMIEVPLFIEHDNGEDEFEGYMWDKVVILS